MSKLLILIEGGMVHAVFSDAELDGVVLDYDIDGSEDLIMMNIEGKYVRKSVVNKDVPVYLTVKENMDSYFDQIDNHLASRAYNNNRRMKEDMVKLKDLIENDAYSLDQRLSMAKKHLNEAVKD